MTLHHITSHYITYIHTLHTIHTIHAYIAYIHAYIHYIHTYIHHITSHYITLHIHVLRLYITCINAYMTHMHTWHTCIHTSISLHKTQTCITSIKPQNTTNFESPTLHTLHYKNQIRYNCKCIKTTHGMTYMTLRTYMHARMHTWQHTQCKDTTKYTCTNNTIGAYHHKTLHTIYMH